MAFTICLTDIVACDMIKDREASVEHLIPLFVFVTVSRGRNADNQIVAVKVFVLRDAASVVEVP